MANRVIVLKWRNNGRGRGIRSNNSFQCCPLVSWGDSIGIQFVCNYFITISLWFADHVYDFITKCLRVLPVIRKISSLRLSVCSFSLSYVEFYACSQRVGLTLPNSSHLFGIYSLASDIMWFVLRCACILTSGSYRVSQSVGEAFSQ